MDKQSVKQKAWNRMETLLDSELPRKRTQYIFYRVMAAASIVLIAGFVAYFNTLRLNPEQADASRSLEVKPIKTSTIQELLQSSNQREFYRFLENYPINSTIDQTASNFDLGNQQFYSSNEVNSVLENEKFNRTALSVASDGKASIQNQTNLDSDQPSVSSSNKLTKGTSQSEQKNYAQTPKQLMHQTDGRAHSEEDFVSNHKQKTLQFITPEIKKSFIPKIDMGLKANGLIGVVSKNFDDYGLRLGMELNKPVSQVVSLNTGIRYSAYKDNYQETYQVDIPAELQDQYLVESMSTRDVARSFIEIPLYADLKLAENFKLKGGASLTYNKNNSETPILSSSQIVNSVYLSDDTKTEAGKLYGDREGYLGEFLVGATLELDKVSFDLEGTRGFINNQNIENRNVIGVRLNYKFGRK